MNELPPPDTVSLAMSGRSVEYVNGYERGYEAAADQMKAYALSAVQAERAAILAALQAEIDHCAMNDVRLLPAFGKSQGVLAVPSAYIEAVMERFAIRSPAKE